jgi:hypothetical protein
MHRGGRTVRGRRGDDRPGGDSALVGQVVTSVPILLRPAPTGPWNDGDREAAWTCCSLWAGRWRWSSWS